MMNKANKTTAPAKDAAPATPERIDRKAFLAAGAQPDAAAALALLQALHGPDGIATPADVEVATGRKGKTIRDASRYKVPATEGGKPLGKLEAHGLTNWTYPVSGRFLVRLLDHLYSHTGASHGVSGAGTAGMLD